MMKGLTYMKEWLPQQRPVSACIPGGVCVSVSRCWFSCCSRFRTQLSGGARHQHAAHLSSCLASEREPVPPCYGVGSAVAVVCQLNAVVVSDPSTARTCPAYLHPIRRLCDSVTVVAQLPEWPLCSTQWLCLTPAPTHLT